MNSLVTMSSEMKPKPDENHEPEPVAGGDKPPAADSDPVECRQQTPEPDPFARNLYPEWLGHEPSAYHHEPSAPEDKEAFRNWEAADSDPVECRQQTPEPGHEPSASEDRKEAFRNRALSVQTPGYSLCEPEPCEYLHDLPSVNVSGYSPPSPSYEPNK